MLQGRLFKDVLRSGQMLSKRGAKKHWDIKWSQKRKEKFYKIDLPDFDKMRREMKLPLNEQQSLLKKEGRMPPRHHQERPIIIASTNTVFEPYIPPEGDGILSNLAKGVKERFSEMEMKRKSFMHLRKVKAFEEDFDIKEFPNTALSIYKEAMELLQNHKKNELRLHEVLTEKAYPEMVWGLDRRTFRWGLQQSVEAGRVVHVRTTELMSKDNMYAQITVRLYTKQLISMHDQYGRLMYGSCTLPRDRLEFVVFEKHLSNEYGAWRVHAKLRPDWLKDDHHQDQGLFKTLLIPRGVDAGGGSMVEARAPSAVEAS